MTTSPSKSFSMFGKPTAPNPMETNQLLALFNTGRFLDVEKQAQVLLKRYPNSGFVWNVLGVCLSALGKDALPALQKTAELLPKSAEAHSNLGSALRNVGRLDDAVACCRRALKIQPDYAKAYSNLGNALQDLGKIDEAIASYRKALALKTDFFEVHYNLGNALRDLRQFDAAMASYEKALAFKPDFAEAHSSLGNLLRDFGQLERAAASYQQALAINPNLASVHLNLGEALKDLGHREEALACCRRALEINPQYLEAYSNQGVILTSLGQLDSAVNCFHRALEIDPDAAQVYSNLGLALQKMGKFDAAAESYRRALELQPELPQTFSNLLFSLSHDTAVSAHALYGEHVRFGEHFEGSLKAHWPQHSNSRERTRPLHLGFVSGDFRNHAIANFIEPVLEQLARHPQLCLHAYYNHASEDAVTQRLRGHMVHWNAVLGLSDGELAQKIQMDGIDILIDLSGHTAQHRLLTFARKPAPIQASWMGYPGTTGLQAMDYYLGDRHFLPVEQFADQFTEKIVHLPANAPFLPFKEAPEVGPLPALRNGYITFGSFNRLSKINPQVIALWAKLLRALPNSHMLLAGLPEEGKYDTLIQWFAQEGINRERLSFHGRSNMHAYMSLHHQVDICLDTFPYTGGTTTMHALWMGVPTLTLAGPTPPGRQGVAILGHVDLPGFVAQDSEDFVRKGVVQAGNLAVLGQTRAALRQRLANSAMGQPELIAQGLAQALRTMWQRWCDRLPNQALACQEIPNMH